ncbi:efflux RND transporter periplasmic adaptor subunit [Caldimonas tepidiphila]|uniref:efflux RND transporter periplasmic adaptor subunit n=1 Tax=Caldimonas tepidiphila TaxID=2315841 RepID=UPI0013005ADB|nr:efflux RND transporter periplasmic adaptor subunit [Caldimonas tepidiphila]
MNTTLPAALACAALLFCTAPGAAEQPPADAAPAGSATAAAPAVRVARFAEIAIRPERSAPATVVARNQARVAAEVAGRIERWTVDAGGRVARGALLAEIDAGDYRIARERAATAVQAGRARLALAESQHERARELVAQGFLSKEALNQRDTELQLARSELAASRSQLASAERALARTRVTAPFAASVSERLAQAGEYVAPGTVLFVLTETEGAELSARLPPEEVASLRAAPEPVFESPGGRTPARLLRVAGSVSAPARTIEARLAPRQPLLPGTEGRLLWKEDRPHLPAALLVRRDGRLGVFAVQDGRARFVPLPQAQEGRAAPAPGLAPDTPLVVDGQARLRDGQPLTVARWRAGGSA